MDDEVWFNSQEVLRGQVGTAPKRLIPQIDQAVTKIVGTPVVVNDPRLIRLVVKWKKQSGGNPDLDRMDNFLKDPKKIAELKQIFRG